MRSVNARIICMIGMNDGAFPRQNKRPSFDLSGDRRPGDRSTREDDRYFFGINMVHSGHPLLKLPRAIYPAIREDSSFRCNQ